MRREGRKRGESYNKKKERKGNYVKKEGKRRRVKGMMKDEIT